jgi:hypothetical protein
MIDLYCSLTVRLAAESDIRGNMYGLSASSTGSKLPQGFLVHITDWLLVS